MISCIKQFYNNYSGIKVVYFQGVIRNKINEFRIISQNRPNSIKTAV
jgi:hypothetical protein